MLTVEQVRNLDDKVRKALGLIDTLKSENGTLKAKLDEYKQRVEQLESVVDGFKLEQLEIEEGIKDVLNQLDMLEDQITDPSPSPKTADSSAGITKAAEEDSTESAVQEPEPAPAEDDNMSSPPPELEIF